MADKSAIEWTDATWNPIVGCSILSPGCTHCYAMGMAGRIEAMTKALKASGSTGVPHYDGTTRKVNGNTIWTGKVALAPDHILTEPLTWRAPRKIFVNSMGDLFHEDVPNEWIDRVFAVMALSTHHTFQILTKRARRMREYIGGFECDGVRRLNVAYAAGRLMEDGDNAHDEVANAVWPLPNVWLGVSAERQQEADERVPELLATPAAVRFVSAEPLLGPIDFERIKLPGIINPLDALRGEGYTTMLHGQYAGQRLYHGLKYGCGRRLDWIIVGGESGPNARPMHLAWARSIRDQCTAAGVPFFFKQWGAWGLEEPVFGGHEMHALADDGTLYRSTDLAYPDGKRRGEAIRANHDQARLHSVYRVGKKIAGRLLDGVEHNALPELREVPFQ